MNQDLGVRKSTMHKSRAADVVEVPVRCDYPDQFQTIIDNVIGGFVRWLAGIDAYRLSRLYTGHDPRVLLKRRLYKKLCVHIHFGGEMA